MNAQNLAATGNDLTAGAVESAKVLCIVDNYVNDEFSCEALSSQSLAEGYLPSVRTEVKSVNRIINCSPYALNDECECSEIEGTGQRFEFGFGFLMQLRLNLIMASSRMRDETMHPTE
jgi:hypothetical protein